MTADRCPAGARPSPWRRVLPARGATLFRAERTGRETGLTKARLDNMDRFVNQDVLNGKTIIFERTVGGEVEHFLTLAESGEASCCLEPLRFQSAEHFWAVAAAC